MTERDTLRLTGSEQKNVAQSQMAFYRFRGKWLQLVTLAMLTLIGGWLRFQSIGFGLPDKFRPDEEYLVSRALGFENDWNPHFAIYPAAQMYVQHAILWTYAKLSRQRGNFRDAYATDNQALAYVLARYASAFFGTASIPGIYFAAQSGFGGGAGMAAAAILSFATLSVEDSKNAKSDTAAVFWLILAIAMALRIARRGYDEDYVGAGLLTGLAAATKYQAGVFVFGIIAAHLEARRREDQSLWFWDVRLLMVICSVLIGFLSATPYFLIDRKQTVNDLMLISAGVHYGVNNVQASSGLRWLMLHALPDSFGASLEIIFVVSLLWAAIRQRIGSLSLVTFIAVAVAGLCSSHYVFYRYLLIPMPAMIILAGAFVADLGARLSCHVGKRLAVWSAVIALAMLLTPSMFRDLQINRLLAHADTRTLARVWIGRNIPQGSTIAETQSTTPYGKPQLPNGYSIVPFEEIDLLRSKGVRWVLSDSFPPLAYYSKGPSANELVQLNSEAELVFDVDPVKRGVKEPVLDAADAFYVPLQNISSMKRPGPRIRIWRIR